MILATSIFQGVITLKFPPTNAFLLRGIFFQFLDLGLNYMHARVFLKMQSLILRGKAIYQAPKRCNLKHCYGTATSFLQPLILRFIAI